MEPEERSPPGVEGERSPCALHQRWGGKWILTMQREVGREICIFKNCGSEPPCHVDQPVVCLLTTLQKYRNSPLWRGPAVCADKEDSPGVAHFRPLSLLCSYLLPPLPKPSLSLPVFGRIGSPGPESVLPPGNQAGADFAETAASWWLSEATSNLRPPDPLPCASGCRTFQFCPGRRPRRCLVLKCGPSAQILRFPSRGHSPSGAAV